LSIHDNLRIDPPSRVTLKVTKRWVHTDTLLAEQIHQERARLVIPVGEHSLVVLVLLHALNVLVEEICRVHRSTLGLGMELSREDGTGVVDEALVGLVVQVSEVLPPLTGESRGVDGVSVVLRSDVALSGCKVQGGNVVSAVSVLQLQRLGAGCESEQLVPHAYTHDRDLRGLHQPADVVHSVCAVSRVARSVGDEHSIEVVSNLVDGVVEGEGGHASAASDEAAKDVLLHTAVDQRNVHVAERRAHVERGLGADTADQVNGFRVNVGLVLIGIVFFANGDASQRRALLTEIGYHLASIDARDSRNALPGTPLGETLYSGPMAVLHGVVLNYNAGGLDVGRLEMSEQSVFIPRLGGYSIVADQRLSEDKNLATVGGIGHGLGISNERSGEDGFARYIGFGTERLS
jgi:hypothetical protein